MFDQNYNGGSIYKSVNKLPDILDITDLWQYTFASNDGMRSENLNFINPQRFKNVGYNKWLKSQVYLTIDLDNYMYAKSPSNSSVYEYESLIGEDSPQQYQLTAEDGLSQLISEYSSESYVYCDTILDNPIEGYRFNGDNTLDVLDFIFPCEESLIQPIINLCLKEVAEINGITRDVNNNATDDLSLPRQQN